MPNEIATELSPRDAIRAQILGKTHVPKSTKITFFGAKIELRQPSLGETLAAQTNPDREAAVIEMLIKQAYVPDTNEHCFEDADIAQFKSMPFGADFIAVSTALTELSDVNFLDGATGSGGTMQNT